MSLTLDGVVVNALVRLTSEQDVVEIKGLLHDLLANQLAHRAEGVAMSAELDRLTTEVSETKAVMTSAQVLLGGLADEIRRLRNDPAALDALATELDTSTNDLATAIAANTPAEEQEPPA